MKQVIYITAIVFGLVILHPRTEPAATLRATAPPPQETIITPTELPVVEYNFKPPLGNAYRFAYGNCTYGVASWTAVPVSGNANQWDDNARRAGYRVLNEPVVGAVAVDNSGYYGHVALVVDVSGDRIRIKEMNYYGFNTTNYRWANGSSFVYIMF